ncbi:MAG TPA: hypothetical protein VF511_04040 [Chthoniobacterales bacterium]
MRRLFLIISLLAAALTVGRAADPAIEEKIKTVRARYAEIERELKVYRQAKRDLPDESAEGGELTAFFKGSSLRKLSAHFFGETGKALEEYYFAENQQLIFVLRIETRYTNPMSGIAKSKTEQRFYFAEGKLIRWLNPDNKDVVAERAAAERERELLASAKKYSALVQ